MANTLDIKYNRPRAYRKKPVVIRALLWNGADTASMDMFLVRDGQTVPHQYNYAEGSMLIETLEGTMHAEKGDYIIEGVKGEFYPCKPDIFLITYDPM